MPIPVSPNPLTQFTTYIPMLSALLGATIGGTISYINLKMLVNLEYYYYTINLSLTEQHITLETVNTLLPIGKRISDQLEKALAEYQTK